MTANELYEKAIEDRDKGRDARAAAIFSQIISEHPNSEKANKSRVILEELDISMSYNNDSVGSKVALDKTDMELLLKSMEAKADAKKAGHVGAAISSILAVLSIFILGVVFLPIAIVIAVFSTINAISYKNLSGILYNLLAWLLITIGAATSPVFLALVAGIFAISGSDYDKTSYEKNQPEIRQLPELKKIIEKNEKLDSEKYSEIQQKTKKLSNIELIDQVYGNYDTSRRCWVTSIDDDPEKHYCMKIIKSDIVNTKAGERVYIVLSSNILNEAGHSAGSHASSGKIGLFIIETENNKIVAFNPQVIIGTQGEAPKEWSLLKLASSEYWGWKTSFSDCHQGYCGSRAIILAPHGKNNIKELANIVINYSDEGTDGNTSIDAEIEVDSKQLNDQVFPLVVRIKGSHEGKNLEKKIWKFSFNTKKWWYIEPEGWPLSDVGF